MADVKAAIFATNSEYVVELQKLIHTGKVLKDDQVVADTGIKEKDFLVIMMAKVRSLLCPRQVKFTLPASGVKRRGGGGGGALANFVRIEF